MPQTLYLGTYSPHKRINETEAFNYTRINTPLLPITVDELKSQIRIDIPLEQSSYLSLIIKSVVRYAEDYMNLSLINTQWRTIRDNFDCEAFELRKGYFFSLEKFQYVDSITGLYVDVDSTIYQIAKKTYYAQILLLDNYEYPIQSIRVMDNAINIEFTAGMAANAIDFENFYPNLKMALLQHCCFAYENRGNDVAINAKSETNALPQMILDSYNRYKDLSIFGGVIYNY
jgi:uncharacterized phiE125 gp8 family phage protein